MMRHVLTADLRDDPAAIDAYKAHHRRVWPEVVRSLQRVGIREMEIYLLARRLVMVVDTDGGDFSRCFAAHVSSSSRVAEWEELMKGLQQPLQGGRPGEWWALLEPVFRLESPEETSDTSATSATAEGAPR
jgi:L-rhamnose mutarotase